MRKTSTFSTSRNNTHRCLEREKDQDSDTHSHMQGSNTGRARQTFHGYDLAYKNNNVKQLSVITAFSVKVGCMSMSVNLNEPNERDRDES